MVISYCMLHKDCCSLCQHEFKYTNRVSMKNNTTDCSKCHTAHQIRHTRTEYMTHTYVVFVRLFSCWVFVLNVVSMNLICSACSEGYSCIKWCANDKTCSPGGRWGQRVDDFAQKSTQIWSPLSDLVHNAPSRSARIYFSLLVSLTSLHSPPPHPLG